MKKEINFLWGSEKKIKISEAGERHSLFFEAYRQALAGITEIVRASTVYSGETDPIFGRNNTNYNGREVSFVETHSTPHDKYFYNYPNNMIVFSGDRGAGKSSAMLTFVSSLQNHESKIYEKDFLESMTSCELPGAKYEDVSAMLRKCHFVSIPPIDPTALENDGQILTVILARMFQLAIDTWEEQEKGIRTSWKIAPQERINRKNELMKQFSTCYEHICAIKNWNKKSSEYEGLDVLADLGDASRLKIELADLVDNLLKFRCLGKSDDPYLIIQIDDTDMNIQQAYAILEDIRRYLVIPKVIIIMAANLKHLVQVVESSLYKSYNNAAIKELDSSAKNIAHQYITKLFPQTRQINLPTLGTYFKEHAENIEIHYDTPGKPILPDKNKSFQDAQEQIFRLIYRKTGLIFLKYKNLLHYIVPGNMRLHAHFLAMLVQMEDVENPDCDTPSFFLGTAAGDLEARDKHREKLRTRLQNVQRFRDYFLTTWATNNLDSGCAGIVSELAEIDVSKKVHFACKHLLHRIQQPEVDIGTYSYADMIRLCRLLEKKSINENDSRFVFAIQTYFSLLGHSVVLEDLVDFYDSSENNCDDDIKCSFSRLYPLYGSRLFSYIKGTDVSDTEDQEVSVRIRQTGVDIKDRSQPVNVRWYAEKPEFPKGLLEKDAAGFLYSMLADYAQAESEGKLCLDLCSPIANCLYLGDYAETTPLVSSLRGSGKTNAGVVGPKQWVEMRNSALLTVLNWDVQHRMGHNLLRSVGTCDLVSGINYENWGISLNDFYAEVVSPFNNPENAEPVIIAALKKLRFNGWIEPLFLAQEGVIRDALETSEWYKVISELNENVIVPSVTESEAEKSEAEKSEAEKSEAEKPEAEKPEAEKPEAEKPEAEKPEEGKPEEGKLEAEKDDTEASGKDAVLAPLDTNI